MQTQRSLASARAPARPGATLRWVLVMLTFVVTMVGYADRQVLGLLKPVLDRQLGWSSANYGEITTAFQIAIAGALLGAGWFMDKVGLRWGFAAGLGGWSLASVLHALARTVPQFVAARVGLGVCEAVGTPAAMKSVSLLFPPEEQTLVIGIGNVAPNVAAMLTPLIVAALFPRIGWRGTIIVLGSSGFVCLAAWLVLPLDRMMRDVARPEALEAISLAGKRSVLADRRVWALGAAKFLTDQAWWFMLFWLPDFFHRHFGLDMQQLGLPVAAIYAMAGLGSLLGGVAPGLLARMGVARNAARWRVMAVFALAVIPVAFVPHLGLLWPSVLLIGLALAAHQGFATNIFGLAAQDFPASRIGAVVGFAAFAGNCGGALSLYAAGRLQAHYGVEPSFLAAAGGYSVAWGVLWVGMRRKEGLLF